jgi:hypothetical protein
LTTCSAANCINMDNSYPADNFWLSSILGYLFWLAIV